MNRHQEIDALELGGKVERYLYIDNELPRGARLAALNVRLAEAVSKDRKVLRVA